MSGTLTPAATGGAARSETEQTLPLGTSALGTPRGPTIGPWEPMTLLGEGSMGQVFLARHTLLGRHVALKVMRPEHARCRDLVQRFFQEARAVNQINHEHIVEVFDFVDDPAEGLTYCVMEPLQGQSLSQLLAAGPLSLARGCGIARQVCEALQAAHRVGVVHRDIKPDNIFVTSRPGEPDFVKVLDFGVAKLLSPIGASPAAETLAGTIVGTPAYMAPEQAGGLPVDHRADIWAVGVVLYQMLAGRLPFEAATFGQLSAQVITQPAPPLGRTSCSGARIPAPLQRLVMRCLEKNPERRPRSMQELAVALEPLSRQAVRTAPARNRLLFAAASLALAASASWALWAPALFRTPSPAPQVRLSVVSDPPGASVIRLDTGERLGTTPLSRTLARSAQPLPLRLELDGHLPLERAVTLERDVGLEAQLLVPAEPAPLPQRVTRDGVLDPFAP